MNTVGKTKQWSSQLIKHNWFSLHKIIDCDRYLLQMPAESHYSVQNTHTQYQTVINISAMKNATIFLVLSCCLSFDVVGCRNIFQEVYNIFSLSFINWVLRRNRYKSRLVWCIIAEHFFGVNAVHLIDWFCNETDATCEMKRDRGKMRERERRNWFF